MFVATKRFIQNLFRHLSFLFLLTGIFIASLFFFATESKYETELFLAISQNIKDSLPKNFTKEEYALRATATAYLLEGSRYTIFGDKTIEGIKANIFHPSTIDLMTGNGACASYAAVLARILKANDMKVRIGQMKVNGLYGGHMFVETEIENGWVVLDPMFNLAFKKQDGTIAGFNDLQANWNFYKSQTPENYNPDFNFAGTRYTNWNKIPVITPAIKSILDFVIGKEKADLISIRPYFLRIYNKLGWVTAFFLFITIVQLFRVLKGEKKYKIQPAWPFLKSTIHQQTAA